MTKHVGGETEILVAKCYNNIFVFAANLSCKIVAIVGRGKEDHQFQDLFSLFNPLVPNPYRSKYLLKPLPGNKLYICIFGCGARAGLKSRRRDDVADVRADIRHHRSKAVDHVFRNSRFPVFAFAKYYVFASLEILFGMHVYFHCSASCLDGKRLIDRESTLTENACRLSL